MFAAAFAYEPGSLLELDGEGVLGVLGVFSALDAPAAMP